MADTKKNQGKLNPFKSTMKKLSDQLTGGDTSEEKMVEYEREIEKLQVQVNSMEEEVRDLRHSRSQLDQAYRQNEKLAASLVEAKNQIQALKLEVEKLTTPPATYAVFSGARS